MSEQRGRAAMSPFSERVEWAFGGRSVGRAAGDAAVASDAAPGPHRRPPRTERTPTPRYHGNLFQIRTPVDRGAGWTGHCIVHKWPLLDERDNWPVPDGVMQNALGRWCGVGQLPPLRPLTDPFRRYCRLSWPVLLDHCSDVLDHYDNIVSWSSDNWTNL